jgi:hypothetical protein
MTTVSVIFAGSTLPLVTLDQNTAIAIEQAAIATAAAASVSGKLSAASNLSDLTNVGAARVNLGLGSAALVTLDVDGTLAANSDSNISSQKAVKTYVTTSISALALGTASTAAIDTDGSLAANSDTRVPSQAAIKSYVDNKTNGLSWKTAVRAATVAAGTLATSFANGSVIDGVTLATGDRILIKDQAAASENGIYIVNASGAPTRAADADSGAELVNATCYISEGTTLADQQWTCSTNTPITLGTTGLTFVISNSGGGTTTNSLTFNNGGAGAASGTAFNGAAAFTISYNTIGAAPLASPALTGNPTAPTPAALDNDTSLATTAFVQSELMPSVQAVASAATFTPVAGVAGDDAGVITALAANLTIAAPTGTPVQMQPLILRIKDNGTAQTLTWNAIFRAIGVTLPTTTVISKTLYVGFLYNATDNKWDCVLVRQEA